jgi:hypothetical protein
MPGERQAGVVAARARRTARSVAAHGGGPGTDRPEADAPGDLGAAVPDLADGGGHDTRSAPPATRSLWLGRALIVASVALTAIVIAARGLGASSARIADQWQLIDLEVLESAPVSSIWYLHTQPPGFNALVGLIAWSPLPLAGTLHVVNLALLAGLGLLIHQMLVRWGVAPLAAGVAVAVALLNPSLLSALPYGHYEILVGFTVVLALAAAQRHLDDPAPRWLLLAAASITLCGVVRSLFHPLWAVAAIAVLAALRPVPRRYVAASLAIPVLVLGGWMVKNQVVFGTPTTSSWLGFNAQRGVVAAMERDEVQDDVAAGRVSPLALEHPWGTIDQYEPWVGTCEPHAHPATRLPEKGQQTTWPMANFNHECYLPVYEQAQADAVRLVREHPGRYVTTRAHGLVISYQVARIGPTDAPTVIDRAVEPLLLVVGVHLDQDDWNLPLLGPLQLDTEISLTLVACSLFIVGRAAVAAVRLARLGWRTRRTWPTDELMWLLVASTIAVVMVGGGLVEFGENGRFRSSLDPLLVALPIGWCVVAVQRRRAERREPAGG